ncbi:hypothetical protein [Moorena sp. SIO3B2]|uniref:hypothetical protein n=1 Tax=Moorena sp. SIO3B2 TaxID=2607827 RepID=UPI00257ADACA|nr:hypothetical protein [Moorena sp. SIO3B2]
MRVWQFPHQSSPFAHPTRSLLLPFPIPDSRLPITYYLLPITYYLLPITYYLLPITYYLLPITYYPEKRAKGQRRVHA